MGNLEIYNKLQQVPEDATKTIAAGRIKGMTDINPMWRIKVMTEVFGVCGIGWKYEITKQWTETHGSEVKAYCNINLYIKTDGEWSDAIPGTGGSAAVSMERSGAYVNDECYKMALTDALSVSMKALGVGADVYWQKGANYESKYEQPQEQPKPKQPQQPVQTTTIPDNIKKEIEAAQNLDELKQIQAKYPDYKADVTFKSLLNARYSKITK